MEFGCFARCRRLIAISQREVTNCYPALLDRRHHILPLIQTFFSEVVGPTFESQNYTFDVYVTSDGRVKLIDFNPWRAFTLPILFTWEESRQRAGRRRSKIGEVSDCRKPMWGEARVEDGCALRLLGHRGRKWVGSVLEESGRGAEEAGPDNFAPHVHTSNMESTPAGCRFYCYWMFGLISIFQVQFL
ncbi:unnamed protein product, partial [Musa acuminata subsp. burmannicoides]